MSDRLRRPHALTLVAALLAFGLLPLRSVQARSMWAAAGPPPAPGASAPAGQNSALDGQLLYEMLVGEMALNEGDAASAYELTLDAARRSKDDGLFRHAVDIALQGRSGDKALAAARAWRTARPGALEPIRVELQILVLLNRSEAIGGPLKALLAETPAPERPALMAGIPRLMQHASNPAAVATVIEATLQPYLSGATAVPARVAIGGCWLIAKQPEQALALARQAQALDAAAPGPVLLALELIPQQPAAEALVQAYLARPDADPGLRLAYVRTLTTQQRYAEAVDQLQIATRQQPDQAAPYLTLGALELELNHNARGEAALKRYIELAQREADAPAAGAAAASAGAAAPAAVAEADAPDEPAAAQAGAAPRGVVQAWLMLAQAAERRGDYKASEAWLAKITDPRQALEVQTRRASILARQGKVEQALALIAAVPERDAGDARAKVLAQAGVLRDAKQWRQAFELLEAANAKFPDDTDLLYEQAMMAEKLDRLDEMERLLRRVMVLKPDSAQAPNALGYSLADRKLRLPEARALIQRALTLTPGDPFITDSMGWVEYRLGQDTEALRLLRQAYAARPDPEIAAHLGEVLWTMGQHDEARRVWGEARRRDAGNDVLRETLSRLRVSL